MSGEGVRESAAVSQSQVLVTAAQVRVLLDDPDLVLLDVRWALTVPGVHSDAASGLPAYRAGHVPGAVFVDLETELSGHGMPDEGRHPLPDVAALQAAARRWGGSRAFHGGRL